MRTLNFCPVVCFFFFFFLAFFSAVADWMSTILAHMVCPLCELQRRSEMQCVRLTGNTGRKKSPSRHHHTTLSGYIFATKARIDNPKKNLLSSNMSSTSPQCGELRPTSSWDRFGSLGHPSKFQWILLLGSVTALHYGSGRQSNCGVEQRTPCVFGRAAITLGIGPHF